MRKLGPFKTMLGMFLGVLILSAAPQVYAQGVLSQQRNVSDKELAAFVKAYVEVQKISSEFEPVLKTTQDPQERQKIQQTGDLKVQAALEKQGMAAEKYNEIFAAVSSNEELRKKTLELIEQEQKNN